MKLDGPALEDLARGAAFLGAGGGGDPYIGRLMAQQAIREFGMPEVVAAHDVPDSAEIYTSAMIGAPTVLVEKIASGDDVALAVRKLEAYRGRRADFIVPIEIGGCNSMIPIVAAARLGLPLVDADGMGRAFPELQMVTFNVYGIPATPASLVDEHGNCVVIEAGDAKTAEDIARANVVQMGLSALMSCYAMTGAELKRTGVLGTLRAALEIGRAIARGRRTGDPVAALLEALRATQYYRHCKVLFDGKIVDLRRETTRGFSIGHCRIEGTAGGALPLEIEFQNENLVARRGGQIAAVVPDLVCVVDAESAEPITTEALRYGQRVKVVAASTAPVMRSSAALAIFGPGAFGIETDFVPLEALHPDA